MKKDQQLVRVMSISKTIQSIVGTAYPIRIVTYIDGERIQAGANHEENAIELTSDLVDAADDHEVAFVIAHEVAHLIHKDHRRLEELRDQRADQIARAMKKADDDLKRGGHGFIFRTLFGVGAFAASLATARVLASQASQEHESEADEFALRLMKQAGFKPQKAISALRISHGGTLPNVSFWNSLVETATGTHPRPDKRENSLKEKLESQD